MQMNLIESTRSKCQKLAVYKIWIFFSKTIKKLDSILFICVQVIFQSTLPFENDQKSNVHQIDQTKTFNYHLNDSLWN